MAGPLSNTRAALFARQAALIDNRFAPAPDGSGAAVGRTAPRYRGPYLDMARQAARRAGVPEHLFLRLVERESGWDPAAVSAKGARGLAQLMPDTARHLGVDSADPAANLDGGARYLRQMYDKYGSWRLALAAYNAGPEAVDASNDVPPYRETQAYVAAILGG